MRGQHERIIAEASSLFKRVSAVVPHFDRVQVRAPYELDRGHLADLQAACETVYPHISKHDFYHASDRRWSKLTYNITGATDDGLRLIGQLPSGFVMNITEPAVDLLTDSETKWPLLDLFNGHHVQGWHRQEVTYWRKNGGVTTGNRRFFYARYADRMSERTHADCLHVEARLVGLPVLRSHRIDQRRLVDFDHHAFWSRHLNLFAVDYERLGIWLDNRATGRRRRQPILNRFYNVDVHRGSIALRAAGKGGLYTVQHLIDDRGRGPWLHRIDVSLLLMSISRNQCNLSNSLTEKTKISLVI